MKLHVPTKTVHSDGEESPGMLARCEHVPSRTAAISRRFQEVWVTLDNSSSRSAGPSNSVRRVRHVSPHYRPGMERGAPRYIVFSIVRQPQV